ncbi:MAG: antitoxin VbhA family protein [Micromonosporaceae bacterium]|nr:antitoxin VbhA family protein [Micromonosporaceae bacterium]
MIPVEVYEELVASRRQAVAQGLGSLRAEGLDVSAQAEVIIDEWVHGRISTSEMEEQIAALHGMTR